MFHKISQIVLCIVATVLAITIVIWAVHNLITGGLIGLAIIALIVVIQLMDADYLFDNEDE